MLFHSFTFLIFFPIFLIGLSLIRGYPRIIYLTIASFIFYAWWYPPYILILLGLSLFAHYSALYSNSSKSTFALSLIVCFIPLIFFKYTHFILTNVDSLLGFHLTPDKSWALPVGISFITFTAVAYMVDVRQGTTVAEKDPFRTSLFISFFPQLVAGPILRPRELFPQLDHICFRPKKLRLGLFLFAIGMTKKVAFADQIAPLVDQIYNLESTATLPTSLFAFYGYGVQIYCDFSGYTDMALGLGYALGVTFPINFNRPYVAASIREFWRSWHMTLSRWLRDYLYISLGGSKHGLPRTIFSLFMTMLLGGLWHGAAWTFVVWGAFHGGFLVFEHLLSKLWPNRPRLPLLLRIFICFHLVGVSWILFRAKGWDEVTHLVSGFFVAGSWTELWHTGAFPICLVLVFLILHPFDKVANIRWLVRRCPAALIMSISIFLIIISKVLSGLGSPSAFIYFDF